MTKNLQDELNKQAKGAKLRANIRSWRVKNAQNFLRNTWKTEYENLNNISIIYWW